MSDELYLFNDGGVANGFTPTLFSKTLSGITYTPAIISRGGIKITDNFSKSVVTFSFNALNSFAKYALHELPEVPIKATIYKNNNVYWAGQVKGAVRRTLTTIDVLCDSAFAVSITGSTKFRMNLHCNHTVYSPNCGVFESNFAVFGTTVANSTILNVPELTQPSGFFNNGKATMNGQVRRILESNGTTIKLSSPFSGALSGSIILYPGCNGTKDNCTAFNNLPNGLFFHKQSSKNPYGTTGLL